MRLTQIAPFTSRNHSLITRRAAERLGVSRSAWYRSIDAGLLELVHPNVARIVGATETPEQRIAAAVLALEPDGLASHRSAARLLGLPRPDDDPVDAMLTRRTRRPFLDGALVHRPRDLGDLDPVRRCNIPCTNLLRTACDIGVLEPEYLPIFLGYIFGVRLATVRAIDAAAARHSRQGRPGVPALRHALAEWNVAGKPPDSVLEPAMARLLTEHRLGPWLFHAWIAGFEVDFWLIGTPIVLECDGWDAHARTRELMEWHAERDTKLIASGYLPVHFTYRQIVKQKRLVAKRINDALRLWAAHGAPDLGNLRASG